jgi:DNA invertase Pin-like site-specific DNA recombinase
MLLGYARTSTLDQAAGYADQVRALEAAGCTRLFAEQISSVVERAELEKLLAFVRDGDVVVVTAIDRLARSIRELLEIKDRIKSAGADLRILGTAIDTTSATGELILGVLGSVAEFERKRMLERQKVGIQAAKAAGRYRGRVPTALRRSDEVLALRDKGVRPSQIAKLTGLGRTSVWRILTAEPAAQPAVPTTPAA